MTRLDEQMRKRLGELARSERSPLGGIERQRLLARVGEHDERRRRAAPVWWMLSAAAVGLLAWQLGVRDVQPGANGTEAAPRRSEVSHDVEQLPGRANVPEQPRVASSSAPRLRTGPGAKPPCNDAPAPEPIVLASQHRNREAIELGDRARFVLIGDARGHLEPVGRCHTRFVLTRGRVVVHARELAGGELVVRTPTADVVVHGTVFDVRFDADDARLRVAVGEGEVGVVGRQDAADTTQLDSGDLLEVDLAGTNRRTLDEADRLALLAVVADHPRPRPLPRAPRPALEEVESDASAPNAEVIGGAPEIHSLRLPSEP